MPNVRASQPVLARGQDPALSSFTDPRFLVHHNGIVPVRHFLERIRLTFRPDQTGRPRNMKPPIEQAQE